jgi:hypothetical protein
LLCGVLEELGINSSSEKGIHRLVAFGNLNKERRARDRERLFAVAEQLERDAGGRGYSRQEYLRSRVRRRLLAERVAAVASEEDRRLLGLLLDGVEAGSHTEADLLAAVERAEGLPVSKRLVVDFEDRSLGPFLQVGKPWKQPIPIPYASMRDFSVDDGETSGSLFLHTGTDSGVRVRNGDKRTGELRSNPFLLGRGSIEWLGCGDGGYVAVCNADTDSGGGMCLTRRLRDRGTRLRRGALEEEELVDLVGKPVFLTVVDDRTAGWGFVALDNLAYTALVDENVTAVVEEPSHDRSLPQADADLSVP